MNTNQQGEKKVVLCVCLYLVYSVATMILTTVSLIDSDLSSLLGTRVVVWIIRESIAIFMYVMIYRGSKITRNILVVFYGLGILFLAVRLLQYFHILSVIGVVVSLINVYFLLFDIDVKGMMDYKSEEKRKLKIANDNASAYK